LSWSRGFSPSVRLPSAAGRRPCRSSSVWPWRIRYPDLVVGTAIGVYVIKEAFEILGEAREARA
jgi:hypothetical protein